GGVGGQAAALRAKAGGLRAQAGALRAQAGALRAAPLERHRAWLEAETAKQRVGVGVEGPRRQLDIRQPAGTGLVERRLHQHPADAAAPPRRIDRDLIDLAPPACLAERIVGAVEEERDDVTDGDAALLRDPPGRPRILESLAEPHRHVAAAR